MDNSSLFLDEAKKERIKEKVKNKIINYDVKTLNEKIKVVIKSSKGEYPYKDVILGVMMERKAHLDGYKTTEEMAYYDFTIRKWDFLGD